jgi:hypothetical protein
MLIQFSGSFYRNSAYMQAVFYAGAVEFAAWPNGQKAGNPTFPIKILGLCFFRKPLLYDWS